MLIIQITNRSGVTCSESATGFKTALKQLKRWDKPRNIWAEVFTESYSQPIYEGTAMQVIFDITRRLENQ
jgi:hypothetical protein